MAKQVGADGVCEYSGFWWGLALPHVILPLHLLLVTGVVAVAASRTEEPLGVVPAGLLFGSIAWTLFEYAFHRWLLHHMRRPALRRIFWDALHREHHQYRRMLDPGHRGVHPVISLPVMGSLFACVALLWTGPLPPSVLAGWMLGYCAYEALHWYFHSRDDAPRSRGPLERLHAAHTHHHLRSANRNYGFVTTFWDRAFGTAAKPR